ncbi:uncharacterized protein At5g08430-like isoform X2 [Lotus japonicus]|uniref:uncharacterized protein At5g08430-like isoform X2 n=1 Tax=Lotus japonicus TaxID=34305 RepID=UPI002584B628|nr:uncharacterized protein At5g08430-like isoform X2 [Lotus japonicus]
MVRTKNKRKKEEMAEDWCFACKDGGLMRVCDYRDCLKAYHPRCVGKDDSFLENDSYWSCASHSCYHCGKTSKFRCLCCPSAVCRECIYVAEIAVVKGNKGFCHNCTKLAYLFEEKADADSDGGNVDFKDRETYECLFSEYYEIIKKEEGLNSEHVHSARNFLKNSKNRSDLDLDEIDEEEDNSGESDVSDYEVSDCDDLNDRDGVKPARKKKRTDKLKSIKGKVKDKKKEFIGWGSRSLIEFLKYTGSDTSRELSEYEVASIITKYCNENNLFDPQKKRKIICDQQLRSLLGRKSVTKNSIQNLLAPHFAENIEEMDDVMDDVSNSSEDRDDNEPLKNSRQRKSISNVKSCQKVGSEKAQSCLAAIVSSNLKLVYLKRSLMEELLKQPETFDGKVFGSFVRIKSDPNDFLQKNSHLLLQVVGINRSSKNDQNNKEILLQLSHVPKDVPICKISDDDFTEGECQDLYQRMRNGLLKQPTILELEQKARSLHEDIIKHWIPRELQLLQNRIDQANERGRRRELSDYMDRKLKLETPLEQTRLLSNIPNVIPEIADSNLSPEGSPREDKLEQNGLPDLAIGETSVSGGCYSKHSSFARYLNKIDVAGTKTPVKTNQVKCTFESKSIQSSSKVRQDDQKAALIKELNCDSQIFNTELSPWQSSNTESGSGIDTKNLSAATRNAKQTIKEKQIISVAETIDTSVNDKQVKSASAIVVEQKVSISTADVIELSDSDEEDVNVADASAGEKMESPGISIWHCLGPSGEKRGPYSMSVLKCWSESVTHPIKFKVWKTGQSEEEAILLTDALNQKFPSI